MAAEDEANSVTIRAAGPVRPASGTLLGRPFAAWRADVAAELGLPAAECTVGTGHQAEVWHPGILAKYAWADEQARRASATVVHLLVDTDTRDPLEIRTPILRDGALRTMHHTFAGAPIARCVACSRPAVAPRAVELAGATFALPCVADGVAAMAHALAQFSAAPDAAAQAWQAVRALLARVPGLTHGAPFDAVPWARTSRLMGTSLGQALLDHAQRDPLACVRAFNAAVQRVPRSARPLAHHPSEGWELPFWVIRPDGTRARVHANELPELRRAGERLAPAGLLTSAIARAALCDRFVHGTGGEIYERATEAFVERWLGARLPAFDMATATVLLPFERAQGEPVVTPALRRRAWFDPSTASANGARNAGPSPEKRALLAAVDAAPRRTDERREAWRAMHAQLERQRAAHAAPLAALAAREDADRTRAAAEHVRRDRTWPVLLYPDAALTRLSERVRLVPPAGPA